MAGLPLLLHFAFSHQVSTQKAAASGFLQGGAAGKEQRSMMKVSSLAGAGITDACFLCGRCPRAGLLSGLCFVGSSLCTGKVFSGWPLVTPSQFFALAIHWLLSLLMWGKGVPVPCKQSPFKKVPAWLPCVVVTWSGCLCTGAGRQKKALLTLPSPFAYSSAIVATLEDSQGSLKNASPIP